MSDLHTAVAARIKEIDASLEALKLERTHCVGLLGAMKVTQPVVRTKRQGPPRTYTRHNDGGCLTIAAIREVLKDGEWRTTTEIKALLGVTAQQSATSVLNYWADRGVLERRRSRGRGCGPSSFRFVEGAA